MPEQPSITCPRCGRTSYNPGDIANLYCGACHWWTSDPMLGSLIPHEHDDSGPLAPVAPMSAEELDVLRTELAVAIRRWSTTLSSLAEPAAAVEVRRRLAILWSLRTHFEEARMDLGLSPADPAFESALTAARPDSQARAELHDGGVRLIGGDGTQVWPPEQ